MLTDKALLDFNTWLFKNQKLYAYNVLGNEIVSNALIIEWLDSVKLCISTSFVDFEEGWFVSILNNCYIDSDNGMPMNHYSNRNEANVSAIKKANEIYNKSKL